MKRRLFVGLAMSVLLTLSALASTGQDFFAKTSGSDSLTVRGRTHGVTWESGRVARGNTQGVTWEGVSWE